MLELRQRRSMHAMSLPGLSVLVVVSTLSTVMGTDPLYIGNLFAKVQWRSARLVMR